VPLPVVIDALLASAARTAPQDCDMLRVTLFAPV
ncbi:uncharacterized protein METZ01_LOCUS49165, partial [marine metagenome]